MESSWRGVLRALNLRATSSGAIHAVRRRAIALGLDTSHFRGNRTWSDDQLQEAVIEARSWKEVAERLRLAPIDQTLVRLKSHALRLQLDSDHLNEPPLQPSDFTALTRQFMPGELRNAAPMLAAAWFSLRGFAVAIPTEPQAYDLLVASSDAIHRIQVKSTTSVARNGGWQVSLSHRPKSLSERQAYNPSDIDGFVVITSSGDLYLLPVMLVAGFMGIHLNGYGRYRVGDVSSLLN